MISDKNEGLVFVLIGLFGQMTWQVLDVFSGPASRS